MAILGVCQVQVVSAEMVSWLGSGLGQAQAPDSLKIQDLLLFKILVYLGIVTNQLGVCFNDT